MVGGLSGLTGLTAVKLVATALRVVFVPAPTHLLSMVARTALGSPVRCKLALYDTAPWTVNGLRSLPGPLAAHHVMGVPPTGLGSSILPCTGERSAWETAQKSWNVILMLAQVLTT